MLDAMRHRGPDASGTFVGPDGKGALGHQRLSIMDPEGGDQPFQGADGRTALVANGEIYNHRELAREKDLEAHLRTGSDSEVIVRMHEARGRCDPGELDGMFAFVLADGEELVAARDPVGIKPLYVGRADGVVYLASEIKALLTVANEVEEVPPGCVFRPNGEVERFDRLPDPEPEQRTVEAWIDELGTVLRRAVDKRLMSDVPLGAFLSGGLDSSILAALARRRMDEMHTFSVGVEGSPDLEAARRVADHLDTIHHEYAFAPEEAVDELPRVLHHLESFDRDLVRSAVPCHFVSRLAARHVKVVLTGEGADELFAGYRYYRRIEDPGALHRELRRSVAGLHDINLQRVDRLTMAHGLEGRVPFLDLDLVDLALRIPPELKLRRDRSGRLCEKWILRKAFEDLLPNDIVWRTKEQFDEGSGTSEVLRTALERRMTPEEASGYAARHPHTTLRSREEAVYHRMLRRSFDRPEPMLDNVARWAERPSVASASDAGAHGTGG